MSVTIRQVPEETTIVIPQGDDWPIAEAWFDDNLVPLNLTTYTIFAKYVTANGDITIPIIPINLTLGQFTLDLNHSITDILPIGNTPWYQVHIDGTGKEETVLSGNIKIIRRGA